MDAGKIDLLKKCLLLHSQNMVILAKLASFITNLKRHRRKYMAEQRALHHKLFMLLLSVNEDSPPVYRSTWEKPRTKFFWEHDCQEKDYAFFKENFRMSWKCFNELCALLPRLKKNDTNIRTSIPLQKRVAIALYALGISGEYRSLVNMFGVGKSIVCQILLEFCKEVWNVLQPLCMDDFPLTRERVEENVRGFQKMGFPQCLGAIDGCHIKVKPHGKGAVNYYNCKGFYSTVLLALVDYRYRIMYLNVGTPGRSNDSSIYEKSLLKEELTECQLLKDMSCTLSNVSVPICILGDSAFKLSPNLMKPYPFSTEQSEIEKTFNYTLSKCRRVVEKCFGHLKARFRRIGKGIDNDIVDNTNAIIKACCVLHNFLNKRNDQINKAWLLELEAKEKKRHYPQKTSIVADINSAQQIRNAIASFLGKWSFPG